MCTVHFFCLIDVQGVGGAAMHGARHTFAWRKTWTDQVPVGEGAQAV